MGCCSNDAGAQIPRATQFCGFSKQVYGSLEESHEAAEAEAHAGCRARVRACGVCDTRWRPLSGERRYLFGQAHLARPELSWKKRNTDRSTVEAFNDALAQATARFVGDLQVLGIAVPVSHVFGCVPRVVRLDWRVVANNDSNRVMMCDM